MVEEIHFLWKKVEEKGMDRFNISVVAASLRTIVLDLPVKRLFVLIFSLLSLTLSLSLLIFLLSEITLELGKVVNGSLDGAAGT